MYAVRFVRYSIFGSVHYFNLDQFEFKHLTNPSINPSHLYQFFFLLFFNQKPLNKLLNYIHEFIFNFKVNIKQDVSSFYFVLIKNQIVRNDAALRFILSLIQTSNELQLKFMQGWSGVRIPKPHSIRRWTLFF